MNSRKHDFITKYVLKKCPKTVKYSQNDNHIVHKHHNFQNNTVYSALHEYSFP